MSYTQFFHSQKILQISNQSIPNDICNYEWKKKKENIIRIAVLSGIHGNYHALRACLSHAIGHGATTFWFLDVTRVPSRECSKEGPACVRIPCCHGAACAKRISCSAFPSHQKKLRFIESELFSLFFFIHPTNSI